MLAELEAAGQLVWSDSDHHTYAAMLQRWYESRRDGAAHPMVHGRNRERRLLNHVAQQVLIAEGSVDPHHSVTLRDGRRLCLGDEVIARHGDRRIHPQGNPAGWMRNGTTGHITKVASNPQGGGDDVIVTITTAAGGELHVGRRTLEDRRGGIDLAYAVTSYAVQGSTRERSTSAITAATSKAELYVDITRGRQSNVVYGTRTITANLDETDRHLPVVERELASELATRLARPDGLPVVIADRQLADLARTAAGMSLAKLHAERRAGAAGPWDEAIERREATLRATATVPARFAAVLPPIPPVPHLEARYRRLAGDVAVWTETHNQARPRRTLTTIETAIGARPAHNRAAASEWDTLANRARRLAVDVTRHHLDERRPELRPLTADPDGWLRRWLDDLAGDGRLATLNVDQLLGVIDDPTSSHAQRHLEPPGVTAVTTSTARHRREPVRSGQLVVARRAASARSTRGSDEQRAQRRGPARRSRRRAVPGSLRVPRRHRHAHRLAASTATAPPAPNSSPATRQPTGSSCGPTSTPRRRSPTASPTPATTPPNQPRRPPTDNSASTAAGGCGCSSPASTWPQQPILPGHAGRRTAPASTTTPAGRHASPPSA